MIGGSVPNSHIRQFEEAIKNGQILMLVEVAENQVEETQKRVKKYHPAVNIEGVESTLPPAV
jgi:hypothetical protein